MTAYREGELFREAWQSVLNSLREEGKVDSPDARKSDREDYLSASVTKLLIQDLCGLSGQTFLERKRFFWA